LYYISEAMAPQHVLELIKESDSREFLEYAVKLGLLLFKEIPASDAFKYFKKEELINAITVSI